jgi:endonuclease/exonuclease/phosphatase family metal-dependent hydrolase
MPGSYQYRRAFAVAAALLLAGCAALNHPDPQRPAIEHQERRPPREERQQLHVVTYNVHMESARHISKTIMARPALRDADLIFLQEIESHAGEEGSRSKQVASALGMSYAYAPGYGLPGGGSHGVAILSRFPLSDFELIELPRHHVVVNSARRVALGATLRLSGGALRIYSVHLDNRINPAARARQLAPVFEASLAYAGVPTIIAGDMNTSPFCWSFGLVPLPCGMQDDRLDAMARQQGFDTPTAHLPATSKWLSMRLDAIYTRGLTVDEVGVDGGARLSDHLPVWIDGQAHWAP